MNFSEEIIINGTAILEKGIGKSPQGEQTKNIIKITRAAIYQNKIVSLNLYIWD